MPLVQKAHKKYALKKPRRIHFPQFFFSPLPFVLLALFFVSNSTLFAQFSAPPNNRAEYEKQYQWRVKQERLFGIYIPKSLDEAMLEMDRLTDEPSKKKFAALPEDQAFRKLFHSLRPWIIQNWGLEGGSRFSRLFEPLQLRHPDDVAELVMISWHRHLHSKDRDFKTLVEQIREKRLAIWQAQQAKSKKN